MQEDSTLQAISTRQLLWDEENRLLGISDNGFVSQYWYDASGERTVKESFDNEGVYVNGALSGARTGTSKFTAYISPYMVVSQGGNYTKHVYMGSQRITSKVSNSGIFSTSPVNTTDLQAKLSQQTTKIKERFDSLGVQYSGLQQTGGLVSASPATTADSYFYHPDHLGSSSLITSGSGDLVQHIQYVPFGEVFVEERNTTWSTPYKFNGKEQDEETGLCYYGARYYDPRTSVWLSVDPLAEKYPNVGSYVYCVNNPVKYIDPDGKDIAVLNLGTGTSQHLAILIQNKEGKWEYFSVNGDNVYLFGNHVGGRKFDDLGVGKFDSPQQFLNSTYNQAGDKDNKEINSYGFPEAYVIKTTKKQDETIRNEFVRISTDEEYSLNPFDPNQCATTVQKSLNKAGIKTAETKTVAVGEYVTVKKKENPYLPSDAFQAIMKDNPNGTYVKKQDNEK